MTATSSNHRGAYIASVLLLTLTLVSALLVSGQLRGSEVASPPPPHMTPQATDQTDEVSTQAQIPSPEDLAQKVAKEFGGEFKALESGEGWIIKIPKGSRTIAVRIMKHGGVRDKPYFRVSIPGKGALTVEGKYDTDPALTHHSLNQDSFPDIQRLVESARKLR